MATKINNIALYNAWYLTSNDSVSHTFITDDDYIFIHGYDVDFYTPINKLYTVTVTLQSVDKTVNVSSRISLNPQNKLNLVEIFGYRPSSVKVMCAVKELAETSVKKILFGIK